MSLTPLLSADLTIQIHAFAAIAAFALGAFVLWREKGTRLHKALGKVWVVLMLIVATSALFINEIRLIGPFSPIHIFSLLTYAGIGQALYDIRRGNVAGHRAAMQSVYLGSLILAGAFTFLPGRRMHETLFGPEAGWPPSLIVIGLGLSGAAFLHWRFNRSRRPA